MAALPLAAGAAYMRGKAARIGLAGESGPVNLFKFPTTKRSVSPSQSPSTVFEPMFDTWNNAFAYNGHGYYWMLAKCDISGETLTVQAASAQSGSAQYGATAFVTLSPNTAYKFHADAERVTVVVTPLVAQGDGKYRFAPSAIKTLTAEDDEFTTSESTVYALIFRGPNDYSAVTYAGIRIEEK